MKTKIFFVTIIFMALMLVPFAVSSMHACDPDSDCYPTPAPSSTPGVSPTDVSTSASMGANIVSSIDIGILTCMLPDGDVSTNPLGIVDQCASIPVQIHSPRVLAAPAPIAKPTAIPLPTPKGDSPGVAMAISDGLHTLDAGAVHWYRIDNGQNFYLDVWLDTSGKSNITLAVYSPEQTNALSVDLPPKGRGAPVKNDPTHDLLWKGSQATGVWYALVRNYNAFPVQYKIGTNQSSGDRDCFGYWEVNAYGQMIFWVDCGHYPGVPKK